MDDELRSMSEALSRTCILIDGHIDVPYRFANGFQEDISKRTIGGDFDYERARAGGLDAPFMAIYVPPAFQDTGGARAHADALIDMVAGFVESWPDKFAHAVTVQDIRTNHDRGLMSLPMGLENGAALEDNVENVAHFYQRGIRYITLCHGKDNLICDSSYDDACTWSGVSPFGRDVMAEMSRLGIMVDVSHVSDLAFYDVLEATSVPVIASHSSARAFTPGWERNMSDEMIRALAEAGGLIMINFGASFLDGSYRPIETALRERIESEMQAQGLSITSEDGLAYYASRRRANPVGSLEDVVAHIDHVKALVGIDHIGIGSDFDGVFALPKGLQDVAEYPNLVCALLEKGYSRTDIGKLLGENFLRVWQIVAAVG